MLRRRCHTLSSPLKYLHQTSHFHLSIHLVFLTSLSLFTMCWFSQTPTLKKLTSFQLFPHLISFKSYWSHLKIYLKLIPFLPITPRTIDLTFPTVSRRPQCCCVSNIPLALNCLKGRLRVLAFKKCLSFHMRWFFWYKAMKNYQVQISYDLL